LVPLIALGLRPLNEVVPLGRGGRRRAAAADQQARREGDRRDNDRRCPSHGPRLLAEILQVNTSGNTSGNTSAGTASATHDAMALNTTLLPIDRGHVVRTNVSLRARPSRSIHGARLADIVRLPRRAVRRSRRGRGASMADNTQQGAGSDAWDPSQWPWC